MSTAIRRSPRTAGAPGRAGHARSQCSARPARVAATEPPAPVASTCPDSATLSPAAPGQELERQGVGENATLHALFFLTGPTIEAGTETKIVWRMTGVGTFTISATGPSSAYVAPIWGPEMHGGSNYHRPGQEWGTGWVFPEPGCWTVTARRDGSSGYLVLRVAPKAA